MRFEALIYDPRDAASPHPESTLGMFASVEDAAKAIANYLYLRRTEGYAEEIYKAEILPESR